MSNLYVIDTFDLIYILNEFYNRFPAWNEICQASEPPTIILGLYFLSAGLESRFSNSTKVAGFPFMPKILVYVLLTKPVPSGSIVEIPTIFVELFISIIFYEYLYTYI